MSILALGLALSLGVQAKERLLETQPGPALRLTECTGNGGNRCWKRTATLRTFVDSRHEVRTIRLQIAQSGANLLVRARGLTDSQSVEITVRRPGALIPSDSQLIRAGNGLTIHPLEQAVHSATELNAHIQVWDGKTHTMHTWDPGSGARSGEPITFWKAPSEQVPPSVEVRTNGDEWWIQTESADQVTIRHRRPALPSGGRGVGAPWSHTATPNTPFASPPHAGDYEIRVRSGDTLVSRVVSWTPDVSPHLTRLGIHPPPKSVTPVDTSDFILSETTAICATTPKHASAADWLVRELHRITPFHAIASCESARIHFEESNELGPQAYGIEVRPESIRIRSASAAGARYGAIAAADMLGLDGTAEAADIVDAPSVARRILFHEVSPQNGPMIRPEQTIDFIERVVSRARFNTLILEMKGGLSYRSHPELSRKDAWTHADLKRVLDTAESHGIEVIPSINSPAHANWITSAHPELMEESTHHLLCTRHPGTRPLLNDLYVELHEAFRRPAFIHIGHDEVRWRTRWKHESQRCPRCAATPRWSLLADDLLWAHDALAALGARPMLWSDMLVPGWHGKWDQMYRASRRIPESVRPDFHVISWGRTGDSVGTLSPLGYAVIRGNTGYADWKRPGLAAISRGVAGEALALFNAAPWSSFQGTSGPTRDYHHWTNVSLAGATAWNPSIETIPIDTSVTALRDHPAYRPGLTSPSKADKTVRLDKALHSGELSRVEFNGTTIQRISIVQSADYDLSTLGALAKANKKERKRGGIPIGSAVIEYSDGSETELTPIRLGLHTEHPNREGRGSLLFGATHSFKKDGTSRYVAEWTNPHPERPVAALRLRSEHDSVRWRLEELRVISTEQTTH